MEEEEPTILEYARFHHLARDHCAIHPLNFSGMPRLSQNFLLDLADPEGAPEVSLPPTTVENERLLFGRDEAMLLRSLITPPEESALDKSMALDHKRNQRRKLELPLLKTDHELDVRSFGQRITPDFRSLNLPFERVDEENDEGLSWPKSTHRLPKELFSNEENGKLQYSRESFLFLSSIVKDARTQDLDLYNMEFPPGQRKVSPSQSTGEHLLIQIRSSRSNPQRLHFYHFLQL